VSFSDLFHRRRKGETPEADTPVAASGPLHPSKALPKFLSALSGRQQPMLLDLGPVVGSNVTFFGEQLGCKIFVENIYRDIDHHVREGKAAGKLQTTIASAGRSRAAPRSRLFHAMILAPAIASHARRSTSPCRQ